jgi:hypothetical protein
MPPPGRAKLTGRHRGTAPLSESIPSYLPNRDLTLTKSVMFRYEIPDASMCQTLAFVVTHQSKSKADSLVLHEMLSVIIPWRVGFVSRSLWLIIFLGTISQDNGRWS